MRRERRRKWRRWRWRCVHRWLVVHMHMTRTCMPGYPWPPRTAPHIMMVMVVVGMCMHRATRLTLLLCRCRRTGHRTSFALVVMTQFLLAKLWRRFGCFLRLHFRTLTCAGATTRTLRLVWMHGEAMRIVITLSGDGQLGITATLRLVRFELRTKLHHIIDRMRDNTQLFQDHIGRNPFTHFGLPHRRCGILLL